MQWTYECNKHKISILIRWIGGNSYNFWPVVFRIGVYQAFMKKFKKWWNIWSDGRTKEKNRKLADVALKLNRSRASVQRRATKLKAQPKEEWDRQNPMPFLRMQQTNDFHFNKVNRRKFVQFLATGLPNRCLSSVYEKIKKWCYIWNDGRTKEKIR